MILEFETQLDGNVIHIPEAVVKLLIPGMTFHVSIRLVDTQVSDSKTAWQMFLAMVIQRQISALEAQSHDYHWKREDAYEHLT